MPFQDIKNMLDHVLSRCMVKVKEFFFVLWPVIDINGNLKMGGS
jgi:hypothetical protein